MAKLINLLPTNQQPKAVKESLEDMDVAIPAKIDKFLERTIDIIKGYKLPRKKEQLVIAKIVDAMNLSASDLQQAVQKMKKYGIVKRQTSGNADHDFMGENMNESTLSTYYNDANADRSTMNMAKKLDNLLKTLITDKRQLEEVNKLITYLADSYAQDEINKTI